MAEAQNKDELFRCGGEMAESLKKAAEEMEAGTTGTATGTATATGTGTGTAEPGAAGR